MRYTVSRPSRRERVTPAASSTFKCLVSAWRLIGSPCPNAAIDCAEPSLRRSTSCSRVGSPSAANNSATSGFGAGFGIFAQIFGLDVPALGIAAQDTLALLGGKALKARFDDRHAGSIPFG